MAWRVTIDGDASDLEAVARDLDTDGCRIARADDGSFRLTSQRFEELHDAGGVLAEAKRVVGVINGAARLHGLGRSRIAVVGVSRAEDDGSVSQFIFPDPISVKIRVATPTIQVDGAPSPPAPVRQAVDAGMGDPDVAEALDLFGTDRSWGALYKVVEIVQADIGVLKRDGVVSDAELRRFNHTANHQRGAGRDARHARATTQPPANPMSHDDAVKLVERVLVAWIDLRSRRSG